MPLFLSYADIYLGTYYASLYRSTACHLTNDYFAWVVIILSNYKLVAHNLKRDVEIKLMRKADNGS